MPVIGRLFPSQKSGEKIFLLLRRHWFSYVAFVIIGFIMSIPLIILFIYLIFFQQVFSPILLNISILAASAYSLFIIALLLYGFIDYYLDVYIVTNERIVNIEQDGFFRRKISELHLHQIQDVNAQVKGVFATLLHYGDIYIQTAGERENFIFKVVPNPYRISKIIVDLHEEILEAGLVDKGEKIAETIEDKEEETSSKNLTLSNNPPLNLDLSTAKLARGRTKKFLGGEELIETEIINKVDEDKKKRVVKQSGNNKTGEMHENEEVDL